MAEDKKKNKGAFTNELLGQDFLAKQMKAVNEAGKDTGLFGELKKMGAMQAYRPVVTNIQKQQAWQPILDMYNTKEEERRSRLAAFIEANPNIDESKLHPGAADAVSDMMKQNNLRFRELNKKLMFMNADHPEYADAVNEINKINETSVNLKADNKKLLDLKNLMIEAGPEAIDERTNGLSKNESDMYDDILSGNKENFQVIDGSLHWVSPNAKSDGSKSDPIPVSKISSDLDKLYKNNFAEREHLKLKKLASESQMIDPQMLNHRVKSLFKLIGNRGVRSMIFDADETSGFYDTKGWFVDWLTSQGIEPTTSDGQYTPEAVAEFERIKEEGVLTMGKNPQFGSVKNHFAKWYAAQLTADKGSMIAPKTTSKTDPSDPYAAFDDDGEKETETKPVEVPKEIESITPKLDNEGLYIGQTGSGDNFGMANSPFAGLTQYGWNISTDPGKRSMSKGNHLFEYGNDKFVVNTLTREYGKYGFTFEYDGGSDGDAVKVTFDKTGEFGRFEFDNFLDKDKLEAKALQEFMHKVIGIKVPTEPADGKAPLDL